MSMEYHRGMCSNPITGFYRDGFCHTDKLDRGLHVVCALLTEEFLAFLKAEATIYQLLGQNSNFPVLKDEIRASFVLKGGKKLTNVVLRLKFT